MNNAVSLAGQAIVLKPRLPGASPKEHALAGEIVITPSGKGRKRGQSFSGELPSQPVAPAPLPRPRPPLNGAGALDFVPHGRDVDVPRRRRDQQVRRVLS